MQNAQPSAKYIVLAVKPQFFAPVLSDIAGTVTKDHIIISIAPGITVDSVRETLGADKRNRPGHAEHPGPAG